MQRLLLYIMALLLLFGGSAMAEDDLDVTMRMVTDEESASDNVAREIRLPDSASDRAREAAAPGLERANEASEKGRRAADAARDRARRGLEQRNQRNQRREDAIPGKEKGAPGGERGENGVPGGDTSPPGSRDSGSGGNAPDRGQPNQP